MAEGRQVGLPNYNFYTLASVVKASTSRYIIFITTLEEMIGKRKINRIVTQLWCVMYPLLTFE